MMDNALLTQEEIALARHCLEYARQQGAGKVRITLSKSLMNLIGLLQTRRDLRMMGPEKMRMTVSSADLDSRVRAIRMITNALAGPRKPQQG